MRACYDCLLSYSNQTWHEMIDRHLVARLMLRLATATIERPDQQERPDYPERAEPTPHTSPGSPTAAFVEWLRAHGFRLPDVIDEEAATEGTRPDLVYRLRDGSVGVFITHPDDEDAQEVLRDAGWGVIIIGPDLLKAGEDAGYLVVTAAKRAQHEEVGCLRLRQHHPFPAAGRDERSDLVGCRHRLSSCRVPKTGLAVLCGPALAEQWQRELQSKLGIHAELVLPSTIRKLEKNLLVGETLFDRYPNIVVSTDFIKRPGLREQFWQFCPDLLIIDEAHTCVSDGTGGRSRMLRHDLAKGLAKNEQRHLILVTATPHSGKEEGFRNLLALLRPALEYVDLETVQGRDLLATYFVQRRRADIRAYLDESTPFPEDRLSQERSYTLRSEYKDLFNDVLRYARETVRDPEGGKLRQRVRYWSALALLRALASSPRAAAATLNTRAISVTHRVLAACMPTLRRSYSIMLPVRRCQGRT